VEGRYFLNGTFFCGDLGHLVFESAGLEPGPRTTFREQESFGLLRQHLAGKVGSVRLDGGESSRGAPAAGVKICADDADAVAGESNATEGASGGEARRGFFENFGATTGAQNMAAGN
jgi:hypothetical protein